MTRLDTQPSSPSETFVIKVMWHTSGSCTWTTFQQGAAWGDATPQDLFFPRISAWVNLPPRPLPATRVGATLMGTQIAHSKGHQFPTMIPKQLALQEVCITWSFRSMAWFSYIPAQVATEHGTLASHAYESPQPQAATSEHCYRPSIGVVAYRSTRYFREPRKGDNSTFCLHVWELRMPYLKCLFHCGRQKRDNISATQMLPQMSAWVVGVALALVLISWWNQKISMKNSPWRVGRLEVTDSPGGTIVAWLWGKTIRRWIRCRSGPYALPPYCHANVAHILAIRERRGVVALASRCRAFPHPARWHRASHLRGNPTLSIPPLKSDQVSLADCGGPAWFRRQHARKGRPLCMSVSVALSATLSVSRSVSLSLSLCLSACLSVSLYLCLCLCLSLSLSLCLSLSLSLSVCGCRCLPACLRACSWARGLADILEPMFAIYFTECATYGYPLQKVQGTVCPWDARTGKVNHSRYYLQGILIEVRVSSIALPQCSQCSASTLQGHPSIMWHDWTSYSTPALS